MTRAVTHLSFEHGVMRELAGDLGAHLKYVARELGITATQHGDELRLASDNGRHILAATLFTQLATLASDGRAVHPADVRDGLRMLQLDPTTDLVSVFRDALLLDVRRRPITARTPNQAKYVEALRRSDVVFGVGPAGTGKTYLAMAAAVAALKRGDCRRIVLTRPAVEAGEKLGFLPGDLADKVDPYLRPLFDALGDMIDAEELGRLMERRVIEIAPLAFMRGRTLNDCHVVLDEAQNTTIAQMKMFLTRLGERGRMVITGDVSQVDLPRHQRSGLGHALAVLTHIEGVEAVRLTSDDVVRHSLVARIIEAYEADQEGVGSGGGRSSRGPGSTGRSKAR